jgi:hypothetical protein
MESYQNILNHRNDKISNLGFNYKGKIFEKTLSKSLFRDFKRKKAIDKLDSLIYELIESVKRIKVHRN